MFINNFNFNYIIDSTWMSASKTRNYLLNDPLIDYLEYITPTKKRKHEDTFLTTIFENGINFELKIINKLKEKFPNQITTIINTDTTNIIEQIRNPLNFKLTIDMINDRVPIIYQGVLHNTTYKTYGSPDLIIRGDYINKIFTTKINLIVDSLYYIIDIKNSQLCLSANSDNILNQHHLKPYKGQILIYHQILSQIQNTDTNIAFILGNRWIRKKQNLITESNEPFDRLGIIDYAKNDLEYVGLVDSAINWKQLIMNTTDLDYLNPNHPNLYPNMTNQSDPKFKKIKTELAESNHEITSLWMCGVKHRNNALKYDIDNWMDSKLNSKILGINGKNGKILDLIIKINQSDTQIIHPHKIVYNQSNWRNRNNLAFYIDFETLNKTAFELEKNIQSMNDIIFMIGIGYSINNKFKYKCLYVKDLSDTEQTNIIIQMIKYIKDISKSYNTDYQDINLYHWSNFEPLILNKASNKFNIIYPVFKWIDILEMFHTEPIIINGALNFSLKTIGKAMHKHGMIKTIWDTENIVSDGLSAMYEAYKLYQNNNKINRLQLKQIIKYNLIDCKIMWDILNALNYIA